MPEQDSKRPEDTQQSDPANWRIYQGDGTVKTGWLENQPGAPPWRDFNNLAANRAEKFEPPKGAVEAVNAALYLRRPVLVTGDPGTGKSSLAFSVARELDLGSVLSWNINSRSTLNQGLYDYDALARLRAANLERLRPSKPGDNASLASEDIGSFITLGAIGTAFISPVKKPRVVLIDEIDKSDVDLPNDLLHVFENGQFEIPELVRIARRTPNVEVRTLDGQTTTITGGVVSCHEFPVVIITSNNERDLPPAFLRRCLPVELPRPEPADLRKIVAKHLPEGEATSLQEVLDAFVARRSKGAMMATDQLLNAFFLVTRGKTMSAADRTMIEEIVFRELEKR
jgi:MoxR-like ATPase